MVFNRPGLEAGNCSGLGFSESRLVIDLDNLKFRHDVTGTNDERSKFTGDLDHSLNVLQR